MKKNNIPLNFREKINSRISLLCSIVVMVLLVLVIHQLDYTLIRKPQKEAGITQRRTGKNSGRNTGDLHCKCNRSR